MSLSGAGSLVGELGLAAGLHAAGLDALAELILGDLLGVDDDLVVVRGEELLRSRLGARRRPVVVTSMPNIPGVARLRCLANQSNRDGEDEIGVGVRGVALDEEMGALRLHL